MDDLFRSDVNEIDNENDFEMEIDGEITQEDAWVVIDKYFEEKGLVRQQIDSFDEFISNTIPELIEDAGEVIVTPQNQFISGQSVEQVFNYLI
jgi:DNA-directed RNA polymerase II subunit RPB2